MKVRYRHDCPVLSSPRPEMPDGARQMEYRWKCPDCGQKWDVIQTGAFSRKAHAVKPLLNNYPMDLWRPS